MPGLRLGYLAANSDIINMLKEEMGTWLRTVLHRLQVRLPLKDRNYIQKSIRYIERGEGYLIKGISEINTHAIPIPNKFYSDKDKKDGLDVPML